jgi:hypothetical protein
MSRSAILACWVLASFVPRASAQVDAAATAPATSEGATHAARATPTGTVHPWAIGFELHVLALPAGHIGIPLAGDESGYHLAAALALRYQLDDDSAIDVGLGLPTSSAGIAVWAGYERLAPLFVDGENVRLEFFVTPGLQLGFAGPDYFARQRDVFVGYGYVYAGPVELALRFPSGLRVSLARSSFDVTASAVPQLLLTPSVELLFTMTLGLLARF